MFQTLLRGLIKQKAINSVLIKKSLACNFSLYSFFPQKLPSFLLLFTYLYFHTGLLALVLY